MRMSRGRSTAWLNPTERRDAWRRQAGQETSSFRPLSVWKKCRKSVAKRKAVKIPRKNQPPLLWPMAQAIIDRFSAKNQGQNLKYG
jgi:hypothetical protein